MSEPEHVASDLPELDRTDDPRGGAAAWALLVVGVALVAGILLLVMWVTGAW
jgi:formate hydrogenlyase subunit 3/multisubunit Na+/H+ antiporter MnhD subunit